MTIFNGMSASPGIAIAKAFVLKHEVYTPSLDMVEDAAMELQRFNMAKAKAKQEIEAIYEQTLHTLGTNKAEIFEGHLLLIDDPELIETIENQISNEHYNAEYALFNTSNQFIDLLLALDDELLRARTADIKDITSRMMSHLRGISHNALSTMDNECIIITHDLTPSETAQLNLQLTKGFITEIGSRTSHATIMARSLEIPAIVGVGESIAEINDGDVVILDAVNNKIIINPDEETTNYYVKLKENYEQDHEKLRQLVHKPTQSLDGHAVELAANIGSLEDIDRAIANGGEGIGLFRTEFLYMERLALPTEEEQYQSYRKILEQMKDKPVVIRTLDIGGDKELSYMKLPKELNPFLGQRALRFCLANPELFRTQLRALLRASIHGNLKIMFPMIAVLEELLEAKQLLMEEKLQLIEEGYNISDQIEIGMMVEIPSVAIASDLFAPHVDFFSIGTNDLIQYTMAADRMNEALTYLYQPLHPSILRLVNMVIKAAHDNGKWVGMCGEMAGDEVAIPLLLGLGLDEFSMSASTILSSRYQISQLNKEDWSKIAQEALKLTSEQQVIQFVRDQR